MIGIGTSLLFGRRAGKAGPPIPPFNKAIVYPYPYPLVDEDEIMNSSEWTKDEEL